MSTDLSIYNIPELTPLLPKKYSLFIFSKDFSNTILRSGNILNHKYSFRFIIKSNTNLKEPDLAEAIFRVTDEIIDPESKYDENYKDTDKEIYLETLGSNLKGKGLGQFLILCIAYFTKYHNLISKEQQARKKSIMGLSDQTGRYGQDNNIYINMGCEVVGDESDLSCDIDTIISKRDDFYNKYVDKGFFVNNVTNKKMTPKTLAMIAQLKIEAPRHLPGFKNSLYRDWKDYPEVLSPKEIRKLQKWIKGLEDE